MIVEIEAKFACDNCGTEFSVGLDPAYEPPAGWSIFAVAEDAIRGGQKYSDAIDHVQGPWKSGTVENDRHYCARCAEKYYAAAKEKP